MALLRLNIPMVPRVLLLSTLTLSILNFLASPSSASTSTRSYLMLIPNVLPRYPWTLVTAAFVERSLISLVATCTGVLFGGKYLDRAWGSREFAQFVAVVVLMSNVAAVLSYFVCSMLVVDVTDYPIHGGIALVASFLVAFKQLIPEYTVTLFSGTIKMRIKHFPALFLLITSLGALIWGAVGSFYLGWLGFLVSWTYLRFFKVQYDLSTTATNTAAPATTLKGDASDIFAFACFFPDAMQPAIAFATDKLYAVFVGLRVLTPFSEQAISSSNEQVVARGHVGLPTLLRNADRRSGRTEEAERRRALAVKALNQRLERAAAERAAKRNADAASSSAPAPASNTTTTTATTANPARPSEVQSTPPPQTVSDEKQKQEQ